MTEFPSHRDPATSAYNIAWTSVIVAFVFLQIFIFISLPHPEPVYDALQYIGISRRPLSEILLNDTTNIPWAVPRPALYPLLLRLLYSDESRLAFLELQFLAMLGAQIFLLRTIYTKYRGDTPALAIVFTIILGIMLSAPMYTEWPVLVYTEALSSAALIVLFAICLRDFRSLNVPMVMVLLCVLALMKYAMVYFAAIVIAFMLLFYIAANVRGTADALDMLRGFRPWRSISIKSGVVVVCGLILCSTWWLQEERHGYAVNLGVVIQMRLLGNPEAVQFFHERGMPVSPSILELSGQPGDNFSTEDRRAFTTWFNAHAKPVYLHWMLTHPRYVFDLLFKDRHAGQPAITVTHRDFSIPNVLNTRYGHGYLIEAVNIGPFMQYILSTPLTFPLYAALYVVALGMIVSALLRRKSPFMHHVLMVSTLPMIAISIIFDAWDLWRHVLPFLMISYLYAATTLFTGIERGALFAANPKRALSAA